MTRVLLVRLSAMGDVVHALGAAAALARARPDLELHFVVQRPFAPLLAHLDHFAGVVAHDRSPALRGLLRTARATRGLRPEIALDLQGNWKSAMVCALSGARLRIGASAGQRREPASRLLLNRVADIAGVPHPQRAALAVVRALAPQAPALVPRLVATEAEIAREAEAVAARGVDPRRPFRVLVAADPRDPRSWPFSAMRRETAAPGPPALWVSGPADGAPRAPDAPVLQHARDEVRRLVALGHLVARAGGQVLGPDKGATHVLAACGAATRVLFGPQDPARTAPAEAEVLLRADGPPCVPCRRRRCTHPAGPICMDFTAAEARSRGTLAAGETAPAPGGTALL